MVIGTKAWTGRLPSDFSSLEASSFCWALVQLAKLGWCLDLSWKVSSVPKVSFLVPMACWTAKAYKVSSIPSLVIFEVAIPLFLEVEY